MEIVYLPEGLLSAITTGFIAYIAIWVIQLTFNIFYLYSTKDKAILTKHIIEILDEALYEETEYNRTYFYWKGINKIVRRAGYTAVYVTKHMAYIIPSSAFDSEEQKNVFYKLIKEKVEA